MSSDGSPPLLEARGIAKRFPGVVALRGVDLAVRHGEVVAVIGENGAGKSTLMKIIAGIVAPDAGEIRVEGREAAVDSARSAMAIGIALIHQELQLVDNLDVAANIGLGREPHRFGWVDRGALRERAARALARVGADFGPETRVGALSPGRRQLVEIARALACDARLLIMDEPTSSLGEAETERLLATVAELRAAGVAVLYISHRLAEVQAVADAVVVLRDGGLRGVLRGGEIDRGAMVRLMVGRDLGGARTRPDARLGEPMLEARPERAGAALTVRAGEIVGLAGLVGSGRTRMLRRLFGLDDQARAEVAVAGRRLRLRGPRDAIAAGIALVPEDRARQGLLLEMAVRENITLASLHLESRGWLAPARDRDRAAAAAAELAVDTPSVEQRVGRLVRRQSAEVRAGAVAPDAAAGAAAGMSRPAASTSVRARRSTACCAGSRRTASRCCLRRASWKRCSIWPTAWW